MGIFGIFKKTYYTVEFDELQAGGVWKDPRMGKVVKENPKNIPPHGFCKKESPEKGWLHVTAFFTDKEEALAMVASIQREEEKDRKLIEHCRKYQIVT